MRSRASSIRIQQTGAAYPSREDHRRNPHARVSHVSFRLFPLPIRLVYALSVVLKDLLLNDPLLSGLLLTDLFLNDLLLNDLLLNDPLLRRPRLVLSRRFDRPLKRLRLVLSRQYYQSKAEMLKR